MAAMVKPGVWRNMRAEYFRSFRKASIASEVPPQTTTYLNRIDAETLRI
jgi:hypothetical protein